MRAAALVLVALAGCAGTREEEPRAVEASEAFGLPPVTSALVFPAGASDVTLAWLLGELARLSGQELALTPALRATLEATREPLELASPVPANEVYPFVEGLLLAHGVYLAPVKGGAHPVLGAYLPIDARDLSEGAPVSVTVQELPALARHPALLCRVSLVFANIDSRQLQTQMRWMLVDTGPPQQSAPAGERSLLLQGTGARIASLAHTLLEADRASAARSSPSAKP